MRTVRSLLALAVVVMLATPGAMAKKSTPTYASVEGMIHIPEVGVTPPPFDPNDYIAYRTTGTSIVSGRVQVTQSDGKTLNCDFNTGVSLYPDTPYMEWAVARWAMIIDHQSLPGLMDFLLGNDDPRIPLPAYLMPYGKGNSAVKSATCRNDGSFEITGVPAGNYLLIGTVGLYSNGQTETTPTMAVGQGPEGPVNVMTGSTSSTPLIRGQQWNLISVENGMPVKIRVLPRKHYTEYAAGIRPFATHY